MDKYFGSDQIVVYVYLFVTLAIGIYFGRGIKSIREYATADKMYGTPVLVLTLLATAFGSGDSIGTTMEIVNTGGVFIFAFFGAVFGPLIISIFIAPNLDGRFRNMISIGDIVKYFYGTIPEKITGFVGGLYSAGIVGAQITALGYVLSSFFQIDYRAGATISGGIIVAYSTFGGIKAVTTTDVLQFVVLIVVLPIIASGAIEEAGGMNKVFDTIKVNLDSNIPNLTSEDIKQYISYFTLGVLPFVWLYPALIQRMLMAQKKEQTVKMFRFHSILMLYFIFMISCIGFSAITIDPNIAANEVMPLIINKIFPEVARGFAIAGILAIIMSTADSFLNSAAILITHNLIKPLKPDIKELRMVKIVTFIIGLFAIIVSTGEFRIMPLILAMDGVWGSLIGIPVCLGILKFKVSPKSFWYCAGCAVPTFIISNIFFDDIGYFSPFISVIAGLIGFFTAHIMENGGITLLRRVPEKNSIVGIPESLDPSFSFKEFIPTPSKILEFSTKRVEKYGAYSMLFAIFFCFNYVTPYFMWTQQKPSSYVTMMILRVTAGTLCIGLMFKDYWKPCLKKLLPLYWHFTVMFCLPFMTTVMIILYQASTEWLINLALSIFFLALVVDWLSFIFIAVIGVVLGYLFYGAFIGIPSLDLNFSKGYNIIYTIIFSTLISFVFARKKQIDHDGKLASLRLFARAIAHEVRTPISAIEMAGGTIRDRFTKLKENAKMLKKDTKNIHQNDELYQINISTLDYEMVMGEIPEGIIKSMRDARRIVDRLLASTKDIKTATDVDTYSITKIIRKSLKTYGFFDRDLGRVEFTGGEDFKFKGSNDFMIHVMYNLIKNFLKYAGSKATAKISLHDGKENSKEIHFIDDGDGIEAHELPYIFKQFYTTGGSTGIGLAFCQSVMKSMGGSITCESEKEKYTKFILTFPEAALRK